jgi:flagellar biosynthetic protein FlhB
MGPLLADKLWVVLKGVLVIVAIIAAVDFFWQRFDHNRKLRMTYQELKDESKQSEGDPHMKAQRRQRAQEIAQNQMLLAVPKADVLIVNPTHYTVALKWDRAPGKAPVCLAKGVDEIAARIREIARREGIPVHEDPPTARSIHALVEVGRQIPPDQYRAVAAAILFADQMRRKARRSGGGVPLTDGAGP